MRMEDSKEALISSAHREGCREYGRSAGEGCGGSDGMVIDGVEMCSGSGGRRETSVGVEMDRDMADGSDGTESRQIPRR